MPRLLKVMYLSVVASAVHHDDIISGCEGFGRRYRIFGVARYTRSSSCHHIRVWQGQSFLLHRFPRGINLSKPANTDMKLTRRIHIHFDTSQFSSSLPTNSHKPEVIADGMYFSGHTVLVINHVFLMGRSRAELLETCHALVVPHVPFCDLRWVGSLVNEGTHSALVFHWKKKLLLVVLVICCWK